MLAVGDNAFASRSIDAGSTWTNFTIGGALNLKGATLFGGNSDTQPDAWVVGESGALFTASSITSPFPRVFGPTTENFTAVRPGLIIGENGVVYTRSTILNPSPFTRQNPSGGYDFHALDSNEGGTWIVGQFGQIYHMPPQAPAGAYLTMSPGQAEFGIQALNGVKVIQIELFNRGFSALNVSSIALIGSSAFTLSTNRLLNITTNSSATFLVTYRPVTQGDHTATIELTHNESSVKYRLPVHGRAQANTWNLLASPNGESLRDLQFIDNNVGFAMTSNDVLKSTNGGLNWLRLSASPPGSLARLHFANSSLGFAFGGGASRFLTCTGACQSFILRTDNGGSTWSSRATGVTTPPQDLHMASTTTGFAVTSSRVPLFGATTPGDVLRTTDGGLSWTTRTRPAPLSGAFNGQSVHAISSSIVFVGASNGQLFRSTDGGSTWASVLNVATSIEDIEFINSSTGWIVGLNGLFRRTINGGATSTDWPGLTPFTTAHLRRVEFINSNTGWIAGDDGQTGSIFRTDNGGQSWFDELDLSASTAPQNVSGRSSTLAFAVAGQGFYRGSPFTPVSLPGPTLPSLRDFGVISFGSSIDKTITVRNVGTASLVINNIVLDDDSEENAFALLSSASLTIPPNAVANLSVRYLPPTIARHHATLSLLGATGQAIATCDLVGEAEVFPTSLIFETQPSGLAFSLDQFQMRGRVGVTVVGESKVPNDVINPFHWRFGTTHNISAPLSQVRDGYEYQFQRWEPSQEATFSLVASNVPGTYRAIYVPIRQVETNASGKIPGFDQLFRQSVGALSSPPTDVPGGPFIRISQASLTVPAMGSIGIQGSAFLSGNIWELSLDSDSLGDPKLMAIDAGSWRLSYTNNVRFVLKAQNPGITFLNKPVSGSSQVLFDITPSRLVAQLSTTDSTPIVPSVVELGPGSINFTNAASGNTRFSSLRATGSLQLLRKPDNNFAVTRSFNFFASDGPFTNTITALPSPILSTPLAAITPGSGALVEVRRNASGVYGVSLRNINFSLLGAPPTSTTLELDQNAMKFTLGKTIAFGQLVYTAEQNTSFEWRFSNSSLKATISPGTLKVPLIPQSFNFDGLTLDSTADFDIKLPLPAFSFDGISIDSGGPIDKNYIRLERTSGVTKFQFRDRRSFFDSLFKLRIDISSAGTASGKFEGDLVVEDFFGCEEIGVDDVSLSYKSSADDYQFQGNVSLETCVFGRHDFRVKFGSSGAKFCHLFCDNDGCDEDVCAP